jgi:hypothetical protein
MAALALAATALAATPPANLDEARGLLKQLGARFLSDRQAAVDNLKEAGSDIRTALVPDLGRLVGSSNWLEVACASAVLTHYGAAAKAAAEPVAQAARAALKADRRARAALLIGVLGVIDSSSGKSLVPDIAARLSSADVQESHWACSTLAALGPQAESAIPALVARLKAKESGAGANEASALAAMGAAATPVVGEMVTLLQTRVVEKGAAAAKVLGGIGAGAEAGVPALIAAMSAKEADVAAAASAALVAIGKPAVSGLVGALSAKDASAAVKAAEVLERMGTRAATAAPALTEAMKSADERLALAAAAAATQADKAVESQALAIFLNVARSETESVAVAALGRLSPLLPTLTTDAAKNEAVKALTAVLQGKGAASVKRAAADGLGALGAAAKSALPALDEAFLLPELKEAAKAAAEKIEPGHKPPLTPKMDAPKADAPKVEEIDIL